MNIVNDNTCSWLNNLNKRTGIITLEKGGDLKLFLINLKIIQKEITIKKDS